MVIIISPEGVIHCISNDAIDLSELGYRRVWRASNVEFDNVKQLWQVQWRGDPKIVFQSTSRQECLSWERDRLNARLHQTHVLEGHEEEA